ncbi:urocanate hydratase [candidate division WOR-3 bacterium]|nr:urocanate hydratase [candidate division WOR-3 bacterium]
MPGDISGNPGKICIFDEIPDEKKFEKNIRRAPKREMPLRDEEIANALKNALRYVPEKFHEKLAPEFLDELMTKGRIYAYRFRPEGNIKARPVEEYEGILDARALQVNIDNNLDFEVALYPYELVTYGETGQVCQNWMQYHLIKKYLGVMSDDQTLVVMSGHPLGLFPSKKNAPRVISTNGLLVGQWDNSDIFNRAAALGVSNYGQMTAGGWMYIGPQGIVHGTYITLLNAGRKYLDLPEDKDLAGILFVSSGLGGMSGAQAKAVEIAGGIGVIAEVDLSRIETRHSQGWVKVVSDDLDEIFSTVEKYRKSKKPVSIGYHGNIVDLLEYCESNKTGIELISDQTSCHAVYEGGYTPAGLTFEEGRKLLAENPAEFRIKVDESLKRHFTVLKKLTEKGAHFWDYGNSFMASVFEAGQKDISKNGRDTNDGFIWPSYVEDIMGPVCFDKGFGPFRWICLSGKTADLEKTDKAAMACLDPELSSLHRDNYVWIKDASKNNLVVGSKARILYADEKGRMQIALKFNKMVRDKEIGPVMLGRDHHDVSGTDSPFRETANIYDGSRYSAEMSVQCFAGNAARGMTLAVLSNGGGVGIGRASNGGFGLVLDGSPEKDGIIISAMSWDVMCGVARRCWALNKNAIETSRVWNRESFGKGCITMPHEANQDTINNAIKNRLKRDRS